MTRFCLRLSTLSFLLVMSLAGPALARPTAMELFPSETLAFGRVAHFRELFEKLKDSSMGRMLQDPNLKPLIEHLYGSAREAYQEQAEEEVGLSLEELQRIPQGEFAIAMVARPEGMPTFALLVDMGDEPEAARKLLDRIQEKIVEDGADEETRTVGGTELTILGSGRENETLVVFERENTIVACGDVSLAETMLAFWDGRTPAPFAEEADSTTSRRSTQAYWTAPLSENADFVAIMRTCRNPGDPPPQIIFYVDPIEIVRQVNRGNVGAQVMLATLPSLGLDGLLGVGGSLTFSTDRYDDITHFHLLLDNPRAGVLTLINLRGGDTTPERFVPSEWIDTYMTVHWNIPLTYEKLIVLFDKFQYQGAFVEMVEEGIHEEAGIDFRREVIEQVDGRISGVFGFPQPVGFNRRSMMLAIHVKDEDAALTTLEKGLAEAGDSLEEESYGGVDYWVLTPPPFRDMPPEERPFEACFAIMEGCFLASNNRALLEQSIAARDGTTERLADAIDFKLVHSRIGRLSDEPGAILFNRPEVGLRYMYELVNADRTRDFLAEQRENNRFFAAIDEALADHPLPAFEVLAKYFAPAGGFFSDTPTGLHYYQFSLRRE